MQHCYFGVFLVKQRRKENSLLETRNIQNFENKRENRCLIEYPYKCLDGLWRISGYIVIEIGVNFFFTKYNEKQKKLSV